MGANKPETYRPRASFKEEAKQGVFKLTYDYSSDDEDEFFDSEHENRRAMWALEQDIDEKLQFWIDCIRLDLLLSSYPTSQFKDPVHPSVTPY